MEIDGAPDVAVEARVEEARGVLERGALGESQLHFVFVGLAGADDAVVLPHRNPERVRRFSPLHRLDHVGIGLFDEFADPRQRLVAPVVQRLDARVDQAGGEGSSFFLFRAAFHFHDGAAFFMVVAVRPSLE